MLLSTKIDLKLPHAPLHGRTPMSPIAGMTGTRFTIDDGLASPKGNSPIWRNNNQKNRNEIIHCHFILIGCLNQSWFRESNFPCRLQVKFCFCRNSTEMCACAVTRAFWCCLGNKQLLAKIGKQSQSHSSHKFHVFFANEV